MLNKIKDLPLLVASLNIFFALFKIFELHSIIQEYAKKLKFHSFSSDCNLILLGRNNDFVIQDEMLSFVCLYRFIHSF